MKSGCVTYPAKERMILIRESQVSICGGNTCAAALLSFLEYWHNIKLDMQGKAQQANQVAEMHGDHGAQDTSLFQFHSEAELEAGIMVYKRQTIRAAIEKLEEWGFIEVHSNPNPRYKFDRTRYFLFKPEQVQNAINSREEESTGTDGKNTARPCETAALSGETPGRQYENPATRTETTAETPSETTTENLAPPPKRQRKRTPNMDMWDAFVETFGIAPQVKGERDKWNGAIKELLDAGIKPGHIPELVDAYFRLYPGMTCNPRALANNLSTVQQALEHGMPASKNGTAQSTVQRFFASDFWQAQTGAYGDDT